MNTAMSAHTFEDDEFLFTSPRVSGENSTRIEESPATEMFINISGHPISTALPQVTMNESSFISPFPRGYSERNFALGVCGLLINAITFPLVATSHKLKYGIKALILNIIINDVFLMSALCVYGSSNSSHRSDAGGCWAVIFLLLVSRIESYMLIFQASFVNFLAIYKPIRFRAAAKTNIIILCIVSGWIYCIAVGLLCVGFNFPKDRACVPFATIPRYGVSGIAFTTIVCFGGVLVLNSASIVLTRKQQRMRGRIGILPLSSALKRQVAKTSTQVQDVKPSTSTSTTVNFRMATTSQTSSAELVKSNPPSQMIRSSPENSRPIDVLGNAQSSAFEHCERLAGKNRQFLVPPPESQNTKVEANIVREDHFVAETRSTDGASSIETIGSSSDKRKSLFHKVELTLIILTTWSCFLSLPYIIYIVWLAAFVKEREKSAMQIVGVMCSSLILINSLTNPFFYSWRFIDWRAVCVKISHVFKCTGRSH